MPQQIRAVVVDPSLPDRLAIREVSLRDPDRDEVVVQGHRDFAQPRRNTACLAGGRGELAARLGFRRGRRDNRRRWQWSETGHSRRRHPALGGLGRAGELSQPCGGGLAGGSRRCPGRHSAGRWADRAACPAPRRAAPWPQGFGRRRLGRGRASRVPARRGGRRHRVGACATRRTPRCGGRLVRRARRGRP